MINNTKKYRCYYDEGHSWLAVKLAELSRLNILNAISQNSFVKGKTAYLEKDYDMMIFINAKILRNEDYTIIKIDHGFESVIRLYEHYCY